MRIERPPYVVDLTRSQPAQPVRPQGPDQVAVQGTAPPARVRSLDRVEISPKARELQRLKQDLVALPDVRLDRVALAKQNLQYGKYRVDPAAVAQSMMDSYDSKILKGDGA
jgi:negative regulator of flagellin synthesis FlgM